MSIINPLVPANPVVQTAAAPVATTEERQLDLRLEQVVRATVVEGGLDKPLLEMNHRHYRAQSDLELQVGQKLTLQVLQTHPTLEVRVVNDPFGGRLSQLLPLLTQPYDWINLLDRLQQQPQAQQLPFDTVRVYQQLQQLLQPQGRLPVAIETNLVKLPVQLQQLFQNLASGQAGNGQGVVAPPAQAYLYYQQSSSTTSLPELHQVMRALQGQLTQLKEAAGRPVPQVWLSETRQLLAPLQQSLPQLPPQLPQLDNLFALIGQLRQQPSLPPQLAGELERILLQLTVQRGSEPLVNNRTVRQPTAQPIAGQPSPTGQQAVPMPAQPSAPPAAQPQVFTPAQSHAPTTGQPQPSAPAQPQLSATIQTAANTAAPVTGNNQIGPEAGSQPTAPAVAPASSASAVPVVPVEVSADLKALLFQVQQAQTATGKLSPELLGRLEGLLDKLQQLPPATQATQPILPGLEMISNQLAQLVSQGPQRPEGGQLGFLSQLFGFHFEAELLKGKQKEALASLKMSLLAMQKEFGAELKEPLQRLELFQLCKARLAEEQVQFLPLPFNELEEGYLLVENSEQEKGDESAPPLQLSLSLRLSALGNMRVDMLYDQQGLHLRMACEDKERMAYLREHTEELEESIETVPLQGVSFAADARQPARQLMERLLPEALGVLDARI